MIVSNLTSRFIFLLSLFVTLHSTLPAFAGDPQKDETTHDANLQNEIDQLTKEYKSKIRRLGCSVTLGSLVVGAAIAVGSNYLIKYTVRQTISRLNTEIDKKTKDMKEGNALLEEGSKNLQEANSVLKDREKTFEKRRHSFIQNAIDEIPLVDVPHPNFQIKESDIPDLRGKSVAQIIQMMRDRGAKVIFMNSDKISATTRPSNWPDGKELLEMNESGSEKDLDYFKSQNNFRSDEGKWLGNTIHSRTRADWPFQQRDVILFKTYMPPEVPAHEFLHFIIDQVRYPKGSSPIKFENEFDVAAKEAENLHKEEKNEDNLPIILAKNISLNSKLAELRMEQINQSNMEEVLVYRLSVKYSKKLGIDSEGVQRAFRGHAFYIVDSFNAMGQVMQLFSDTHDELKELKKMTPNLEYKNLDRDIQEMENRFIEWRENLLREFKWHYDRDRATIETIPKNILQQLLNDSNSLPNTSPTSRP